MNIALIIDRQSSHFASSLLRYLKGFIRINFEVVNINTQ